MFHRKQEYEMLNKMLDDAISGEFDETLYDESELSKLQGKLERYLSDASISAKNLKAEKENLNELITNISHQTKTPLTNILIYSELLQEKADSKELQLYAEEIRTHGKKLDMLLESLVKISRLEVGVFQYERKQESLQDILHILADMGKINAAYHNLSIQVMEEADCKVYMDKKWTTEALYNILDNAIKYSPEYTTITLSSFQYEMFAGIRIRDEGIGLSEDEIPRIFGRFYRGKDVHDKEGIGVGLYLTREIIEDQGGYIKVISQKGKGATFEVYLPK